MLFFAFGCNGCGGAVNKPNTDVETPDDADDPNAGEENPDNTDEPNAGEENPDSNLGKYPSTGDPNELPPLPV